MLHSVRNHTDIPATVKNMEEYYRAVFGSTCHWIWIFVAGVEFENDRNTRALRREGITNVDVKMSSEVNRSKYVYRRLANFNDQYFPDEPGLEWLRLPVTGLHKSSKRDAAEADDGSAWGKKKQKSA